MATRSVETLVLTIALYLLLCGVNTSDFFPGFQPLQIPEVGDEVIIVIPAPTTEDINNRRSEADPVLTA